MSNANSSPYITGLVQHSAPVSSIQKLKRVQNNAARIVLQAPRRSHAKPLMRQLHWLPVQHRIDYKVSVLTYKTLNTSVKTNQLTVNQTRNFKSVSVGCLYNGQTLHLQNSVALYLTVADSSLFCSGLDHPRASQHCRMGMSLLLATTDRAVHHDSKSIKPDI